VAWYPSVMGMLKTKVVAEVTMRGTDAAARTVSFPLRKPHGGKQN